jgi:hypothetical protein
MRLHVAQEIVRSGFLFVLSVILVIGFYHHATFYSIGFLPLVLVGGVATFLVITAARVILRTGFLGARPVGDFTLRPEEVARLLLAPRGSVLVQDTKDIPTAGEVVRARDVSGLEIGRLLTIDCRRKLLADLSDEEAEAAGWGSADAAREGAGREDLEDRRSVIALVEFERIGMRT